MDTQLSHCHTHSPCCGLPCCCTHLRFLYGPNGSRPLVPYAQPNDTQVYLRQLVTPGGASSAQAAYVQIENTNPIAVDVSGWEIKQGASFKFAPGASFTMRRSPLTNHHVGTSRASDGNACTGITGCAYSKCVSNSPYSHT